MFACATTVALTRLLRIHRHDEASAALDQPANHAHHELARFLDLGSRRHFEIGGYAARDMDTATEQRRFGHQ